MTPEEEWLHNMKRAGLPMPTNEDSIKNCARCKRLESLLMGIQEAWAHQHETIDGYRRLKFYIDSIESENINGNK